MSKVKILLQLLCFIATAQAFLNSAIPRRTSRQQRSYSKTSPPGDNLVTESRSRCGIVPEIQSHEELKDMESVVAFGQVPWQVGIFYGQDESFLCSGTLISRGHVLTAAICLVSVDNSSDLTLRLGDWDISNSDSPYEAYKTFRTTVRNVVLLQEDEMEPSRPSLNLVALLFVSELIDLDLYPQVTPICLPELKENHSSFENSVRNCSTSGWGHQEMLEIHFKQSDIMIPANSSDSVYKPKLDSIDIVPSELNAGLEHSENLPSSDQVKGQVSQEQEWLYPRSLSSSDKEPSEPGPVLILVPMALNEAHEDVYMSEVDSVQKSLSPVYYTSNMDPIIDPVFNADLDLMPSLSSDDAWMFEKKKKTSAEASAQKEDVNLSDIPLHHRTMFRHKEKYKNGKELSSRKKFSSEEGSLRSSPLVKRSEIQDPVPTEGSSTESSSTVALSATPQPLEFFTKAPAMELAPTTSSFDAFLASTTPSRPWNQAILKETAVILQRSCAVIPELEKGSAALGNACIISSSPDSQSLCLVDLGSPVSCRGQLNKKKQRRTRNISSRSKVQDVQEEEAISFTRQDVSILYGIVTWKRPCFAHDPKPFLQRFNFVAETSAFLPSLLKKLKSEG